MMRFAWQWLWKQIFSGVVAAGYDDVNPAHVALFRYPGLDQQRPSALAEQLQITKQSVNDLPGHLEHHGYVTREPDPNDGRARIVDSPQRTRFQRPSTFEPYRGHIADTLEPAASHNRSARSKNSPSSSPRSDTPSPAPESMQHNRREVDRLADKRTSLTQRPSRLLWVVCTRRALHGLAISVDGELGRQPRGMPGRPRRVERTPRFLQEARAAARVAEDHGEAGAFLDHERGLGARTRLGDEGLGAPEACRDGSACRRAVEGAQDPRSREMCAGFPGAGAGGLRRPDRPLDRGAGRLAVTEPELRLGHVGGVERREVSGQRERLSLLEGLECSAWLAGGEMSTPERVIRRRLHKGAPRSLRMLERLAAVS
jgi:hypothetical protein